MSIIRAVRNCKRRPGGKTRRAGCPPQKIPGVRGVPRKRKSEPAGLAQSVENLAELEGLADTAGDARAGSVGRRGAADQEDGDVRGLAAQGRNRAVRVGLNRREVDQGDVYLVAELREVFELSSAGERIQLHPSRTEPELQQRHHR